jgi:hypothetical protein
MCILCEPQKPWAPGPPVHQEDSDDSSSGDDTCEYGDGSSAPQLEGRSTPTAQRPRAKAKTKAPVTKLFSSSKSTPVPLKPAPFDNLNLDDSFGDPSNGVLDGDLNDALNDGTGPVRVSKKSPPKQQGGKGERGLVCRGKMSTPQPVAKKQGMLDRLIAQQRQKEMEGGTGSSHNSDSSDISDSSDSSDISDSSDSGDSSDSSDSDDSDGSDESGQLTLEDIDAEEEALKQQWLKHGRLKPQVQQVQKRPAAAIAVPLAKRAKRENGIMRLLLCKSK